MAAELRKRLPTSSSVSRHLPLVCGPSAAPAAGRGSGAGPPPTALGSTRVRSSRPPPRGGASSRLACVRRRPVASRSPFLSLRTCCGHESRAWSDSAIGGPTGPPIETREGSVRDTSTRMSSDSAALRPPPQRVSQRRAELERDSNDYVAPRLTECASRAGPVSPSNSSSGAMM